MKVRDLMVREVISIPQGATYEAAARVLADHHIGGAPVLSEEGEIVGMISEKDLYKVLYPFYQSFYENPELYQDLEARESKIDEIKTHTIDTYMSRNVVTIEPDAPIMKAGALMLSHRIHRLPVMEAGKMIGIITRKQIYLNILRSHLS